MPTFDVTSEVDMQEVRNAVDQAAREVANRFDFKGTDSTIELGDDAISMSSATEDRLAALRQVLEEKMVRRSVSLKALTYGDVEDASGGRARAFGDAGSLDVSRTEIFAQECCSLPSSHHHFLVVESVLSVEISHLGVQPYETLRVSLLSGLSVVC